MMFSSKKLVALLLLAVAAVSVVAGDSGGGGAAKMAVAAPVDDGSQGLLLLQKTAGGGGSERSGSYLRSRGLEDGEGTTIYAPSPFLIALIVCLIICLCKRDDYDKRYREVKTSTLAKCKSGRRTAAGRPTSGSYDVAHLSDSGTLTSRTINMQFRPVAGGAEGWSISSTADPNQHLAGDDIVDGRVAPTGDAYWLERHPSPSFSEGKFCFSDNTFVGQRHAQRDARGACPDATPYVTFRLRGTARPNNKTFLTATVCKASPDQTTGISFGTNTRTGAVMVTKFRPNSLFSGTDMVPEAEVISINNKTVRSGAEAADMIRKQSGLVTLLAITGEGDRPRHEFLVTAAVMKDSSDSKVGVKFQGRDSDGAGVIVSGMNEDSLFAKTNLCIGMRVLSINNGKPATAAEAVELVGQATSIVTILAKEEQQPHGPPPMLTTVTAAPVAKKEQQLAEDDDMEEIPI